MLRRNNTEITVGMFAVAGIAALLMLAMKVSNLSSFTDVTDYKVFTEFENIGDLMVGSPVTMAGVRVGRVGDISLNTNIYHAKVTLNLYPIFDTIPIEYLSHYICI